MHTKEDEIDALHRAMKQDPKQAGASRATARKMIEQLHEAGWLIAKIEDRMSLADAAERIYMEGSRP